MLKELWKWGHQRDGRWGLFGGTCVLRCHPNTLVIPNVKYFLFWYNFKSIWFFILFSLLFFIFIYFYILIFLYIFFETIKEVMKPNRKSCNHNQFQTCCAKASASLLMEVAPNMWFPHLVSFPCWPISSSPSYLPSRHAWYPHSIFPWLIGKSSR